MVIHIPQLSRMKPILFLILPTLALVACSEASDISQSTAPHVHGPHDGVVAEFRTKTSSGYLEVKLHDDKGDLEVWLSEDNKFTKPFDLPLEATLEVEFTDKANRKVTLRPRNKTNNEDEAGVGNIRNAKTNYFIFPSQPGEDASWLKGKDFHAVVIVRAEQGNLALVSQQLKLAPHSH